MERNITPHAINGIAKILREQREDDVKRDRWIDWKQPREELLNSLILKFAVWLEKNGIDSKDFIQRSGYKP